MQFYAIRGEDLEQSYCMNIVGPMSSGPKRGKALPEKI